MREETHISDILVELERDNLLPAIVFRTARSQCDTDALRSGSNRSIHLPVQLQRELRACVHEVIRKYDMDEQLITTHPQYTALIFSGVGAHHAGQLLMWRLLLEELMAAGLLRILVATGTVAAGVDFPARTVVITAHSKRGSDGYKNLTSAEFQQMSGRAGRRGKDTVGFCLAAPSPFCDARQLLRISQRPPEPLTSAYFPAPSTVLNLLRYRNVDDLRFTVSRSLAAFLDRKEAKSLYEEAESLVNHLPEELRIRLEVATEQGASDGSEDGTSDEAEMMSAKPVTRDQKKLMKRIRRTRRQAVDLEQRQVLLIDSAFIGLQQLGYVEGISLSPKGFWAANLCTGLVLELGEIIESGILNDTSAEMLAAIVASIAGDPHRKYLESKSGILSKEAIAQLEGILKRVAQTNVPGLATDRQVIPAAAYTVTVWMQTETWHEFRSILALKDIAEGDAARLITQTADHLNQLTRLSETHQKLCFRAEEAKRRILRPPLTEGLNLETI